jgi:nitrate/nitrite-specific signal transduction histidine kinase
MAQRALAIGADLAITSTPGHGTTVTISLADRRRDERQAPVAS